METIIYSSPKKYVIVDIKNLLNENNIPVSSIQLYITVNMDKRTKDGVFRDTRERRGELTVPIEEFDEKLNDAETLEIYVEEEYSEKALSLIEEMENKIFYRYCIFESSDYDEADTIQRLLIKNDIPCDDVYTNFLDDNTEEYWVCLDPAFHAQAHNLLKRNYQPKPEIIDTHYKNYKKSNKEKLKIYEQKESISLRHILIILLIIIAISFLLYSFRDSIPIVDRMFNAILGLFAGKLDAIKY
jgi:hypothetical protein